MGKMNNIKPAYFIIGGVFLVICIVGVYAIANGNYMTFPKPTQKSEKVEEQDQE